MTAIDPTDPLQNTWDAAKRIVADASEMAVPERDAFVLAQCANRPALLAEVNSLLAHVDGIESYIEQTPGLPTGSAVADALLTGQTIGPYRMGDPIGQGGMGVVYAAERVDGAYTGKVAIKVLKGGNDAAQDARRMTRERQALAQLDHPHIARLLDGGTTLQGAPYLVMEFVDGVSIDTYCASKHLTVRERVTLVSGVCAAVQSAHQRLLVHRDIKPSNVLVTAQGNPKLLDFGIARLLEPEGQLPKPDATQATALLFTPRYASPEQVRGQPVTVATDVYGLGMLLYELLAGAGPYLRMATTAAPASNAAQAADALLAVLQDEPARASEVASRHGTNLAGAAKALRGELDTILLKACAKLPAERYATVADLDADLTRWLQGRPILAVSQSVGYRIRKLVLRQPVATLASVLALLAIGAGVVGTVVQKTKAEARYAQVRAIANQFIFKYHDAIESLPGSLPVRRQLVDDGLKFLDDLSADAATNAALAAEQAAGYRKLALVMYNGRNLSNLGDKVGAAMASARARGLLEAALLQSPLDDTVITQMAQLEADEAALLSQEGKDDASLAKFDAAIARLEPVVQRAPASARAGFELSYALMSASQVQSKKGLAAAAYLKRAQAVFDRWSSANPNDPDVLTLRQLLLSREFMNAVATKDLTGAVAFADQEISAFKAYFQTRPDNFLYRRALQTAYNNKGAVLNLLGQHDNALAALSLGLQTGEILLKSDPQSVDARTNLARTYFNQGKALFALNKPQEASGSFAASAQAYRVLEGKDLTPLINRQRGEALWWLAKMQQASKDASGLKRTAQELSALAAAQPEVFSKPPASEWLTQTLALAVP